MSKYVCSACDSKGYLAPAPSCHCILPRHMNGWVEIQKCDACEQYETDRYAARKNFETSKEWTCNCNRLHIMVKAAEVYDHVPKDFKFPHPVGRVYESNDRSFRVRVEWAGVSQNRIVVIYRHLVSDEIMQMNDHVFGKLFKPMDKRVRK